MAGAPAGAIGGQVAIYGLGNAAVTAFNFLLFPIYARALEPADYGAMSLIATVCALVSMVGLMGMNNAVQRFFFDEPETSAQERIWSTGLIGSLGLTVVAMLLAAGVFVAFKGRWPELAGWPAMLALLALVPQMVVTWLQDRARLQFRPVRYATIALGQAIVAGGLGILFVAVWRWGLGGFFAAALAAASVTAVAAFATARAVSALTFSRREFMRLVKFGAPFVPAGAFIWVSSAVLRWMLAGAQGLGEAGIFDVAWKLAAPVWMLNIAVGQAFSPYAFRIRASDPDYRAKLVEALHAVGAGTLGLACGVMLFAREVCVWIAPAAYEPAAGPCAILALAFYFSATHQVTALGIAFAEKSHLVAVGWGAAAAASAALALVLVPPYGAAGAAWCVVLVYAALSLFYVVCTQRLHPLPFRIIPVGLQAAVGAATVVFALMMQQQPLSAGHAALKLAWWIAAAGLLLAWGGVSPQRLKALLASRRAMAARSS